ncbi:MAG: histone deacetylase [Candidatus Babeliales bacterium]
MRHLFLLSILTLLSFNSSAINSLYKINIEPDHTYQIADEQLPIVYDAGYNISLSPRLDRILSWFHPFDTKKYGKIYHYLVDQIGIQENQFHKPEMIDNEQLLKVHSQEYLDSLKRSVVISRAIDLKEGLAIIPNSILQKCLLNPMRLATGGTIKAAQLAMQKGWAINLSGGYHHAKKEKAEGGCIFGDIQLAIETLWEKNPNLRVLIVDLDAHQGNGHEDYFKDSFNDPDKKVFIFDMYNKNEYPKNSDNTAQYIDKPIPLDGGQLQCKVFGFDVSRIDYAQLTERVEGRKVNDEEYLNKLKDQLSKYLNELEQDEKKPDLIIYNAGTDPFEKDNWGCMNISFDGMIARDQFVWQQAKDKNIPILMVLSGGYSAQSAPMIAKSIEKILIEREVLIPIV